MPAQPYLSNDIILSICLEEKLKTTFEEAVSYWAGGGSASPPGGGCQFLSIFFFKFYSKPLFE